jgi:curved DNA-binding protein CbpA
MSSNSFDKSINPYKLLNVPENYNLEMLKSAYKKVAFKAHPDKGGSEYLFNLVTECYKHLAKELKKKENDKLHFELKQESQNEKCNNISTRSKKPSSLQDIFYSGSTFDQQKFNRFFDDNKFKEEVLDAGYQEWMSKNKIKTTPHFKGGGVSQFNEHFEKNVKPAKDQKGVIKWQEPQPLVASNKLFFSELGKETIDDFSGDNRTIKELNYMDYKVAHTTSRIIDPSTVKRHNFTNIQELEKARANVQYQMDERESLQYAEKMKAMKDLEQKRRDYLATYDKRLEQHYQKIHGLIGFNQRE